MKQWMIAAVPPLLAWFGLFLYMLRVEAKMKRAEERIARSRRAAPHDSADLR